MAREAAAIIGSGTSPFTTAILADTERGVRSSSEVPQDTAGRGGLRTGTQVMVGNPEDITSVDAFATSGVTVGAAAVQIVDPLAHPLPRTRKVVIQNLGTADVFIGHKETDLPIEGFQIENPDTAGQVKSIEIPLMQGVSVWAIAPGGSADIRMLLF